MPTPAAGAPWALPTVVTLEYSPSWVGATVVNLAAGGGTAAGYSGPDSYWLFCGGYGLTIPAGYKYDGLYVAISGQGTCDADPSPNDQKDIGVQLAAGGVGYGDVKYLTLPLTNYAEQVLGPDWGFTFSDAQVEASTTFGVRLWKRSNVNGPQVWVDYVTVILVVTNMEQE